jgi:hypothetical protein
MSLTSLLSFLVIVAWGFVVLRHKRLYRTGVISLCLASFGAVLAMILGIPPIARAIALSGGVDTVAQFARFMRSASAFAGPCYVIICTSTAFLGLICFRALSEQRQ